MFTGDQERLIRLALQLLAESDRRELREIDEQRQAASRREAELQERIAEIEHMLYLPFGD